MDKHLQFTVSDVQAFDAALNSDLGVAVGAEWLYGRSEIGPALF